MRISDWSSDVCSSDLVKAAKEALKDQLKEAGWNTKDIAAHLRRGYPSYWSGVDTDSHLRHARLVREAEASSAPLTIDTRVDRYRQATEVTVYTPDHRSEEHTSELQSLMRISYAVYCLEKKI